MSWITFWKKEEEKEKEIFKAIVIKRLLEDVEELRNKVKVLEEELIKVREDNKKTEKTESKIKLTKLEKRIIETYETHKPKNMKQMAKLMKTKVTSMRVYVSRLRSMGFEFDFEQ
jgi:hypothetical protein